MAAGAGRGYERIGVGYRRHRRPEPAGQQASVAALPFPDAGFDAALAVLTVHHWTDPLAGSRRCSRSTAGRSS